MNVFRSLGFWSLLLVGHFFFSLAQPALLSAAPQDPRNERAMDDELPTVVRFANGQTLEASVTEVERNKSPHYTIETKEGIVLELPQRKVRVTEPSDRQREYLAKLKDMEPTVEYHWEMQQWCRENKLNQERNFHLLNVLEIDPNHKEARTRLGYTWKDGRWLQQKQRRQLSGYVKDSRNHDRIPQGILIGEYDKKQDEIHLKWKNELKALRKRLDRPRDAQAAWNKIAAIDDPAAVSALSKLFDEEKNYDVQELLLRTIAQIQSYPAQRKIVLIAISHPEFEFWDICLDALAQPHIDKEYIVNYLTQYVTRPNVNNDSINRAGTMMGELGLQSAVRPLIDGLVTSHQVILGGDNGNISVGSDPSAGGMGGMQMGGNKKKVVIEERRNQDVLMALQKLTNAPDFGYNEQAWLDWYINNYSLHVESLNRDD